MAVFCAATVSKGLQWKNDSPCWRQGPICQDQVEMLPLPGCRGRLGGLQCKLLTGGMDEMARNSSSFLQPALWLPRGPAIPGVGTASPLAATATILQSFPRSNLWFSVAAAFAAGHNSNAQTC